MRAFAALVGLILFAGCLGSEEPANPDGEAQPTPLPYVGADGGDGDADADDGGAGVAPVAPVVPPPGCDAQRPAIVHSPGGIPIVSARPRGIPCFVSTQWGTGEPSIGVTSTGTLFLYPAYQAPAEQLTTAEQFTGLGIARSQDQGETFTRQISGVGGEEEANFHPYTADPFMFVDPYTDRVFMEDLAIPPFNCANLSYSDDEGDSWTQTVGGCLVWDHVGWGSGPATVSDPSYPVVIQRCAITYVATTLASQATGCQKTLDGGATWEPPGNPAFFGGPDGLPYVPATCNGAAHHVSVDHRGWTWIGRDWCGTGPWIAMSKDEGATWTQSHVFDGPMSYHDVAVGADSAGNAYAFWIDHDRRPVLSVSKDDGMTWSEPWDIAPPGLTAAGMVNIATGGAGKAGFTYAGEFDGTPGVHAVVAAGYDLDTEHPIFHSAIANAPDSPINDGDCNGGTCDGQADFLDASIGPDGSVWGSYTMPFVAAGRLWGAPSLWDESDPNGVFGGWERLVPA